MANNMVLPISCNECRRRKIRCDRVNPCKNCTSRSVTCSYPAKFRSIELEKLTQAQEREQTAPSFAFPQANATAVYLASPQPPLLQQSYLQHDTQSGLPLLQPKQTQLPTPPNSSQMVQIQRYEQKIKELETKLRVTEDLVSIFDSSATSDNNHFGPHSIISLEYSLLGGAKKPPLKSNTISKNNGSLPGFAELTNGGTHAGDKKRPLPILIKGNEIANTNFLNSLVKKFFDRTKLSFFNDMFEESDVLWFLNSHSRLDPWDHDNDMMVLLAILIDSLKESLLYPVRIKIEGPKTALKALVNYYFQISKSQATESLQFMKSQVLLINYFYYCYEFEKCWKMLFSTVSNAYAHGIHIVQGPLWKKITLLEAVLCSISSRPNAIHGLTKLNVTQEEDPYREYEMMNILKDRNMSYIEACLNDVGIKYQQVLQLDLRFENYNTCLTDLLSVDPTPSQRKKLEYDKVFCLLMISLSEHLKLHFPYFEKDRFSDLKTMELITLYTKVIVEFCQGKILNLRDYFSALECHLYQFLLIFLKYLNFKTVSSLLLPQNNFEIKSHKDDELSKLASCQSQILQVLDKADSFYNKMMRRALDLIRSIKISELSSDSFVSASPGTKYAGYYANTSIKDALESSMLAALKDISELEPPFLFD